MTAPAGHMPKKPPKKKAEEEASALTLMVTALYAVDNVEEGVQYMM